MFRQVEGAALVKGGKEAALGEKFIAFLRSEAVQKDVTTTMWMYPVMDKVSLTRSTVSRSSLPRTIRRTAR